MQKPINQTPQGDPSEIHQSFPSYDLQLHCCRYWWLKNWEFRELSFPFWRIYHNSYQGGTIIYEGKEYPLSPDKIIVITPNTSYSTRLYNHQIPRKGFALLGDRTNAGLPSDPNYILHLFIHFNLGIPYDHIKPGLYVFDINTYIKEKLDIIKKHLNYEHASFNFHSTIAIHSLIIHLLSLLPENNWQYITDDHRFLHLLSYIESNINNDLSNPILAKEIQMSTNAFTRLFAELMGSSPQKYVKQKRVDKACVLLHHTNRSIEEIAGICGFADRYHFSRIFKQITHISPAVYRKNFSIN